MHVVQKEISVSRALAGQVLVKGTDEPAGGVMVELCSSDWKTVLASTKTDDKGAFFSGKTSDGKTILHPGIGTGHGHLRASRCASTSTQRKT